MQTDICNTHKYREDCGCLHLHFHLGISCSISRLFKGAKDICSSVTRSDHIVSKGVSQGSITVSQHSVIPVFWLAFNNRFPAYSWLKTLTDGATKIAATKEMRSLSCTPPSTPPFCIQKPSLWVIFSYSSKETCFQHLNMEAWSTDEMSFTALAPFHPWLSSVRFMYRLMPL